MSKKEGAKNFHLALTHEANKELEELEKTSDGMELFVRKNQTIPISEKILHTILKKP